MATVVAALGLALFPAHAKATYPGSPGLVAYEYGDEIWVMQPDGSGQSPITTTQETVPQIPRWSADGRWIVFSGYGAAVYPPQTTVSGVFAVHPDGSDFHPIVTNLANADSGTFYDQPTFTPDGRAIVTVTWDAATGQSAMLRISSSTGRTLRTLIPPQTTQLFSPSISPNGRLVAYQNGSQIWLMRKDGSDQHVLFADAVGGDNSPDWSPDGSRISFDRQGLSDFHGRPLVFSIRRDGSGLRRCSDPDHNDFAATWSPDGARMILVWDPSGTTQPSLVYLNPSSHTYTAIPNTTYFTAPAIQPVVPN